MTAGTGGGARDGALARLVGDVDAFAETTWERQALVRPGRPADGSGDGDTASEGFADLFTLDDIDELVSVRGLRTPFLRLVKDGRTILEQAYIGGGGTGAAVADQAHDDGIYQQMADGATLVLQGLHRMWPPLGEFARRLSSDLGHPAQVNAYVTPAQSQGFGAHYDVHDVFVLQLSGEKQWIVHEPVFDVPLPHQPSAARAEAVTARAAQEPVIDTVLRPGDVLYLPRGFLHSAKALGGVSAHLTIGVPVRTRYDVVDAVLEQVRARAADDPAIRAALPLGSDPLDAAHELDVVREALTRVLAELDPGDLVPRLERTARAAARPEPIGPLAQLRARDHAEPGQVFRVREDLRPLVSQRDDGAVELRGRFPTLVLPPSERGDLDALLAGSTLVRPADEQAPAARLLRRLVSVGVVVPAD